MRTHHFALILMVVFLKSVFPSLACNGWNGWKAAKQTSEVNYNRTVAVSWMQSIRVWTNIISWI